MLRCRGCPVPLTVRGTQALVSFAPLAFELFYAARQNAVLRRSQGKLDDETIRALKPRFQTDHLNSYLCDDPSNFFLLYGPLNRAFGFERLMGYKKKLAGDAWDGVVYFVKKAIEIEYGLYGSR